MRCDEVRVWKRRKMFWVWGRGGPWVFCYERARDDRRPPPRLFRSCVSWNKHVGEGQKYKYLNLNLANKLWNFFQSSSIFFFFFFFFFWREREREREREKFFRAPLGSKSFKPHCSRILFYFSPCLSTMAMASPHSKIQRKKVNMASSERYF
mgnify:CR=1 FL=1